MAICTGEFPRALEHFRECDDLDELADEIADEIFDDVFRKGLRHKKSQYRKNACVGAGPAAPGEHAHHLALQCAIDSLMSNEGLAAIAAEYGIDEVTREHVESLIHHPLNVVNSAEDDHREIHREYNSRDDEHEVSHLYQHVREQSFRDQIRHGLDALERHSHDNAWQNYLGKADHYRNNRS